MRSRLVLPVLVALLTLGCVLGFVTPAQAAEPTVSITGPAVSVAGQSVAVRVVAHDGQNNPLYLTIAPRGAEAKDYPVSTTTNEFDDTYRIPLTVTTRITVHLGDAASDEIVVFVRPVVGTKVVSKHGTSGRYALIKRGVEPLFRSGVAPKIWKGRCLRHELQRYRAGAWRPVLLTGCRSLNSEAQVGWRWLGSHPVGPSFRVRAVFRGDEYNASARGAWTHFRFR